MYNPYQTHADASNPAGNNTNNMQGGQQFQSQMNMPHQGQSQGQGQGQSQSQSQGQSFGYAQHNQQQQGGQFNQFFNDPTTQMGLKFSQSAFSASQHYMQQNLEQFVSTNDIKYYFKVSNAYVLKKLMLIIFPYKNKGWIRQTKGDINMNGTNNQAEVYATPIEDINAPDLYIPAMAFLSYILVWALEEGVKGDFHPEMLGYATTRTLAFYLMDFILLRVSFYVLGISSKNRKMWDLVSYTGYKFVPILLMLLMGIFSNGSVVTKYIGLLALVFSHGFFLMRSLRYVVLPGGGYGHGHGESRLRIQYLFLYCFVVQGVFMWLLT